MYKYTYINLCNGKMGKAMVHIGAVDAPVTIDEIDGIKVIDIFGNDTSQVFGVEVK